ncbi:hypothetical protein [Hymenobacter latericus]|uniref:hypothetical protein n=1 Tax=Hymenobacter sp. YIM 151858-1 TaxID=2987688 RepID=UPI0022274357|nr:hypothetical protein [Hymenobacter sp. YIM 151858-1]UYZ60143.1 hypothetical protein OIS50_04910 [Hymenobacter sp. YIM 151858-1]
MNAQESPYSQGYSRHYSKLNVSDGKDNAVQLYRQQRQVLSRVRRKLDSYPAEQVAGWFQQEPLKGIVPAPSWPEKVPRPRRGQSLGNFRRALPTADTDDEPDYHNYLEAARAYADDVRCFPADCIEAVVQAIEHKPVDELYYENLLSWLDAMQPAAFCARVLGLKRALWLPLNAKPRYIVTQSNLF